MQAPDHSLKKQVLELLEVVEQVESKASCAIVLIAVLAVKGLLLSLGHNRAVAALHWIWVLSCEHHTLILMLAT
jgi:hypothetical protein